MGSRGFSVWLSSRWYLCTWKNPISQKFPNVGSETVLMFDWQWPSLILSRKIRLALPLSTPLSSRWSVVSHHLALCPQVMSQASQHFWSFEKQATCEDCFACQSVCSFVSLPLRGFSLHFTPPPPPHHFSLSLLLSPCRHCSLAYLSSHLSLPLSLPPPPPPPQLHLSLSLPPLFPSLIIISYFSLPSIFSLLFYLHSLVPTLISPLFLHPPPPPHPPFLSLPPLSLSFPCYYPYNCLLPPYLSPPYISLLLCLHSLVPSLISPLFLRPHPHPSSLSLSQLSFLHSSLSLFLSSFSLFCDFRVKYCLKNVSFLGFQALDK